MCHKTIEFKSELKTALVSFLVGKERKRYIYELKRESCRLTFIADQSQHSRLTPRQRSSTLTENLLLILVRTYEKTIYLLDRRQLFAFGFLLKI